MFIFYTGIHQKILADNYYYFHEKQLKQLL